MCGSEKKSSGSIDVSPQSLLLITSLSLSLSLSFAFFLRVTFFLAFVLRFYSCNACPFSLYVQWFVPSVQVCRPRSPLARAVINCIRLAAFSLHLFVSLHFLFLQAFAFVSLT